jgi:PAS domain S-box-containing protein
LKDENKTKELLIDEMKELRQQIADLERVEALHRQAEEVLRLNEEKYRTVADFTYDWEDWLDPNGKYIYVSPSCERISGYRPDEFMADPELVIKIAHPDDRDLVEEHFRKVLGDSVAIHNIDFRISKRSGEVCWISHFCQPVYGKDGNFLGRRASGRDITKRIELEEELKRLTNELKGFNVELSTANEQLKEEMEVRARTEKALKESEERYKRMVSAVTAYTYSVDLSHAGAISTRHSMGCIPVTGYNPEDYEADPYLWRSMIYPDDWMMVENSLKEILSGHEVPPIEHRLIRRDGKVVWVRNTVAPYYDGDGHLIRYDGLIENITERKQAEEEIQKLNRELEQHILELREANKELDAFNHTISHDLQTPLIVIRWATDRLMKNIGSKLDTKEKDMLNTIQTSVQKMDRLIKDLLSFSRLSHQKIEPKEIHMMDLVTAVLDELKTLSEGRMIQFDIKALPPAFCDIGLLKQVLVNLLSNAIKFTRPKDMAIIEIGCRAEENENIYYVKDNGIGFYPQYADKLFSVFYRLPDAKSFEGTGIGLSIVQSIISRHGGRVWAEGRVNEGATFYFSLPNKV